MLNRKTLKIYFCGPIKCWDFKSYRECEYVVVLSKFFEIEFVSPKEADYFLVNETLNSRSDFFRNYRDDVISILISGEALCPDFNLYDYALGFDPLDYGDRYLRFDPAYRFSKYLSMKPALFDEDSEKMFCNYIYSNFLAHPVRDELFHTISEYKMVNSYGRHLNNMGNILSEMTSKSTWAQAKNDLESRYKFSISAENSFHLGYTSEKVFTAFAAGSVPIYWGNPQIGKDVNPNRLINVHDFDSLDELREFISFLDSDDLEYSNIVSQPWFTQNQLEKTIHYQHDLEKFLLNIFAKNKNEMFRKGLGTSSFTYVRISKLSFPIGRRLRVIQELSNYRLVPKRLLNKIRNFIARSSFGKK